MFSFTVKTLTGKYIVIDNLYPTNPGAFVKLSIQDKEGIPPEQQRILGPLGQLDNDRSIQDQGIQNGTVVNLILRLTGMDGHDYNTYISRYFMETRH